MAASQAGLGYNSKFYMGSASSPISYNLMSELSSINLNDFSVPAIDVTHLTSPNTTEEMIPGMIKPGTIQLHGNFIGDSSQLAVNTAAVARTVFAWKITSVLGTTQTLTITGNGFISKQEIGPAEPNKKLDFKVDIQVTGTLTYNVA
jgi:hypothetical protein